MRTGFRLLARRRLAYDGKTLGAVSRIFMDSVLGWYRRRMRDEGIRDGRSGAVMVVQRNSADLKLSPHLHAIFVDGVFATVPDGKPFFHALPRLSTDEVADLLQVVRVRVQNLPRAPCCGVLVQGESGVPKLPRQEDERGGSEFGGSRPARRSLATVCGHGALPAAISPRLRRSVAGTSGAHLCGHRRWMVSAPTR